MQQVHPRLWIFALVSALGLLACRDPALLEHASARDTRIVYVVRRSWHIDIGFAAADLQPPLAAVRSQFPGATYVEFGFGDRRYLMNRQRGPGTLLSALWPGPGLVLMTALSASPQDAFGTKNVYRLHLSSLQTGDIQQFIWHTLVHDQDAVAALEAGPYEGSVFYAALPRYSAVHTCNTWAAESLRAAQLPIRSTGVVFAGQLWSQVQPLAQLQGSVNGRED
jgi:hypothetical protein